MSIKNLTNALSITGSFNATGNYPSHVLFCLNTPWYDVTDPIFAIYSNGADQNGWFLFSLAYGTYAILSDRGGAYGDPLGEVKVDPGYNLNDNGKTNRWTWIWLHRDSLSMRGFRVDNSQDFTAGGAFSTPQAGVNFIGIGGGLPTSSKLAHLHFYNSLTSAQYDAIRAGTLDPTSLSSLTDGFTFATGYNSVKGTLQATPLSGSPTFDADNPATATSGNIPPTPLVRSYRSGMGW